MICASFPKKIERQNLRHGAKRNSDLFSLAVSVPVSEVQKKPAHSTQRANREWKWAAAWSKMGRVRGLGSYGTFYSKTCWLSGCNLLKKIQIIIQSFKYSDFPDIKPAMSFVWIVQCSCLCISVYLIKGTKRVSA